MRHFLKVLTKCKMKYGPKQKSNAYQKWNSTITSSARNVQYWSLMFSIFSLSGKICSDIDIVLYKQVKLDKKLSHIISSCISRLTNKELCNKQYRVHSLGISRIYIYLFFLKFFSGYQKIISNIWQQMRNWKLDKIDFLK